MCLVKGKIDGPWTTWAMFPEDVKDDIWNKLLVIFITFLDFNLLFAFLKYVFNLQKYFCFEDNDLARLQFDKYVNQTYKNNIYVARQKACKKAGVSSDDIDRYGFLSIRLG